MTASRPSSGHTGTQVMPNCITSQGQGASDKNGSPGSNHPCRPAHWLGIIDYLCTKGKWWALLMSRSAWPQQSNLLWLPQDAYCRRSCTQIHKFTLLHQAWCMSWILVNSPWWRIKPLNYLQQPLWEVPLPASCLWSGLFTRHLPEEDEPVPWRVPWMYQNHQWHHCTWSYWGRTQCPSAEPHVSSPQVWSCVQSTENACKGPSHKILWLPIWCQWCPPGPREGWCCTLLSQHPQMSLNFKSSSAWWHTSAPLSMACPLWLLLCENSWKKKADFTWNASYEVTFSVSQASCCQWHHPQKLWPITACDHTRKCLTGRSWCSTSTKQQTCSFCKQSTHWCRTQICKHRDRC